MADAETVDRKQENREKAGVALSSLLAASVLTLLKLLVGVATNSLGILCRGRPFRLGSAGRRRDALGGPRLGPAGKPRIYLRTRQVRKPLRPL